MATYHVRIKIYLVLPLITLCKDAPNGCNKRQATSIAASNKIKEAYHLYESYSIVSWNITHHTKVKICQRSVCSSHQITWMGVCMEKPIFQKLSQRAIETLSSSYKISADKTRQWPSNETNKTAFKHNK
jgi:hypothetical protein